MDVPASWNALAAAVCCDGCRWDPADRTGWPWPNFHWSGSERPSDPRRATYRRRSSRRFGNDATDDCGWSVGRSSDVVHCKRLSYRAIRIDNKPKSWTWHRWRRNWERPPDIWAESCFRRLHWLRSWTAMRPSSTLPSCCGCWSSCGRNATQLVAVWTEIRPHRRAAAVAVVLTCSSWLTLLILTC